jgi:hypothetical protein
MWLFLGMGVAHRIRLLACLSVKTSKLGMANIYREELKLFNRVASSPENPHTFSIRESSRK